VTPHPKLIGVYAKIDRAKYHLSHLHVTIETWARTEQENQLASFNYDPDRERVDLHLHRVKPGDINWPLIVGDVVHNLRSALDHLVFQLALLNGASIDQCKKTFFPVCIAEPDLGKALKLVAPYVHPNAWTLIKELQPYKAANIPGKDLAQNYLWIISQLDIIDKHRMLVVTDKSYRASSVSYSINDAEPVSIEATDTWKPLKDGAKLASFDISGLPFGAEDKMRMNVQTEFQIRFKETGCGCEGLIVEEVMRACINRTHTVATLFDGQIFNGTA
jgi:hypothetical protein